MSLSGKIARSGVMLCLALIVHWFYKKLQMSWVKERLSWVNERLSWVSERLSWVREMVSWECVVQWPVSAGSARSSPPSVAAPRLPGPIWPWQLHDNHPTLITLIHTHFIFIIFFFTVFLFFKWSISDVSIYLITVHINQKLVTFPSKIKKLSQKHFSSNKPDENN